MTANTPLPTCSDCGRSARDGVVLIEWRPLTLPVGTVRHLCADDHAADCVRLTRATPADTPPKEGTTMSGIFADQALDILMAEGHPRDDVLVALDSLINAGLELDQPDDGYVLTPDELDVLREQLRWRMAEEAQDAVSVDPGLTRA